MRQKLFLLHSWAAVLCRRTWASCRLGGSPGSGLCDGNAALQGEGCRPQPALRRASGSAPAGTRLPPSPRASPLPEADVGGCPRQRIPRLLRATKPVPWEAQLELAALRSEEVCSRANLPCLPLLWPTFCSQVRIRQDDARGFSSAPQKAPSQPDF